ncbi:hypothetical protein TWF694_000972 [Orbilia ellipsospora]|uniref:Mitochondrial division protein 1 n=1 Tax=Orbilia ellipsospora TaxID=2528407 RepID=A0AAV9XQ64_9PEZI
MPAGDSPDVLVARFLRANNFKETFEAFVRETNLTPESITNNSTDLTIEQILEEKKLYDLAVRFEKLTTSIGDVDFAVPYPNTPTSLTTLSSASNILSLTLTSLFIDDSPRQVIISTTSDKALRIYSAKKPHDLIQTIAGLHTGPILCVLPIAQRWLITASMSRDIAISDIKGDVLHRWEGHGKYIVKLAISEPLTLESSEAEEVRYIAAASYDKSLSVHKLRIPLARSSTSEEEGEERGESKPPSLELLQMLKFPDTVEDVIFSKDFSDSQNSTKTLLVATIRDSAYLHIYSSINTAPASSSSSSSSSTNQPFTFLSKTPLNATSTTWLTYTPTSLSPHPQHPHLLALITSSLPAPKLILYNLQTFTVEKEFAVPINLSAYSTGIVTWRGDANASGVWVNGDDGLVKGVEVKSGKVMVELKGHEGRKVRCLVAGIVAGNGDGGEEEEVMVSGGFDGGLKVWRVGGGE